MRPGMADRYDPYCRGEERKEKEMEKRKGRVEREKGDGKEERIGAYWISM